MTKFQRQACQLCKKPFAAILLLGVLSFGVDKSFTGNLALPIQAEAASAGRLVASVTEISPPHPDINYQFPAKTFTKEEDQDIWVRARERVSRQESHFSQ